MAIQIEKDGWKVSADTVGELETAIGVLQRALQGEPGHLKRPRGRPPGRTANGEDSEKGKLDRRRQIALPFLRAIAGANTGLPASGIVAALQLQSKRAIGSVAQTTNRLLKDAGFEPSRAYYRKKKPGQEKTWFPKPSIHEIISALEGL